MNRSHLYQVRVVGVKRTSLWSTPFFFFCASRFFESRNASRVDSNMMVL